MQVKTFTGRTSQEILARIKAEMGPDAVILSNRTYTQDNSVVHEITAGVDRESSENLFPHSNGPGISEWQKEWLQIKNQLFALMKPAMQLERLSPRQRVALEYLQREGASDAVIVELYNRLLAEPGSSVLECLYAMVPVKSWGQSSGSRQTYIVTGPYGSGKTTTALRLALHLRKNEPEARIAFINADCLRGNGRLVLRHWAELSNFSYIEAPDKAAMEQCLNACGGMSAVFVDAPGLPSGRNYAAWLEEMGISGIEATTLLVLSPFFDPLQVKSFLHRYKSDRPTEIVWTKLDETECFGSIVNVACASGMPITALSFGAQIKESLVPATEALIWRLIFKRQIPGKTAQ
ncbi:MAG: flagellar biosynthesis protein FlhF [Desulfovibrio sp.]|jgi:flagellar biosynthesis protein FlhF|nr:flagellar biosynthesis protein FlhF [Desulfovibrio sp.]